LSGWTATLAGHAPALTVILPLIAGASAALAPGRRLAQGIVLGGALLAWVFAFVLFLRVAETGVVSYGMGGFPPSLGVELHVDALGSAFVLLMASAGVLTFVYAGDSVEAEIGATAAPLALGALSIVLAGLIGLCLTGDAFNAFVCLEISSIAAYALVAAGGGRRSLEAALNYLIAGTIGATFFVLGVGFLYTAAGTLNMQELADRLPSLSERPAVRIGLALVLTGLCIKAAVFPLHAWLTDAYTRAPSAVTVLLSATATKAAIYLIIRFSQSVFSQEQGGAVTEALQLIAPCAAAGAVACSVLAMLEPDLRRLLAFSSAAQIGFILLAVCAGAVAEAVFYIISHSALKAGLFMCAGAARRAGCGGGVSDLAGLGANARALAIPMTVCLLSLSGIPLTGGFIAKFGLFEALIGRGWLWAAGLAALGSALTLLYCARLLEVMWMRSASPAVRFGAAPVSALACAWAAGGICLLMGLSAHAVWPRMADAALAVQGGPP